MSAPLAVGTIRLDVPKLAVLETRVKSPTYSIGNLLWRLVVKRECREDEKNLAVYIYCDEENKSPHWRCEAVAFHLLAQKSGQQTYSKTLVNRNFNVMEYNRGIPKFMKWEDVLKPEEGFIRESDGGITIEAVVTVTKVVVESVTPAASLSDMSPPTNKRARISASEFLRKKLQKAGEEENPIALGKIRLVVPKLAELETRVESPVVYIANMPWSLEVMSECSERTSNIKQLSPFVYCNKDNNTPHWSCEASVFFNLLSQKVDKKLHSQGPAVSTYNSKRRGLGYPSFIAWDKVLDPENGFIREEDGGVVVEATVTVKKVIGLPMPTLCDFTAPQPNLTDVVLIVEEKPLHVSKTYLAHHSPYFNSMFFSDFVEKTKKEIPLPDVTYDEFVELLLVMYPSRKPVTADTVEGLLCVADFYNVSVVLRACEDLLKGPESKEIPLAKKLLWAEQYNLANLQFEENDFTAPQPYLTDVALIVEEKPLHVCKQFLALYSLVFNRMFFGEFAEKKEIPLEDVKYDEFVELLHQIYPSRKPITAGTVEFLLRLADRFNVRDVLCDCENFLCGAESSEIPIETKLLMAERYQLGRLMSFCFNSLKTIKDIRILRGKKECSELSDKTKAALFDKILDL